MKSLFCATSVAALMLATSGCAGLTHFNKSNWAYGGHTTHFVDAKQRIVSTSLTVDSETKQELYAVCAEPSPDALSALAAAQGFSLSQSDVQAALSNSLTEGAGSIGLRTQSIQLMRDSMYRLCEAHMSGFIGDLAFETLHRRFQSSMVAILAIEQLTSVARPPAITLGGISGGAGVDLVAESSELMLRADRDHKAAEEATSKAQGEYDIAKAALDKRKPAADGTPAPVPTGEPSTADLEKAFNEKKTTLEAAKKREADLKEELEYFQSARRAALAGARTEVRLDIEGGRGASPHDAENISELADAVQMIVQSTLTLSFSDELCTTLLVATANGQLYEDRKETFARISEDQLEDVMPLLKQSSDLRGRISAEQLKQDGAFEAIRSLAPDDPKYNVEKAKINATQVEIDRLSKELSELDLVRSLIIGQQDNRTRAQGFDVIEHCLQALRDHARAQSEVELAQRDLVFAKQAWEDTKSDIVRATLRDNPANLVPVINALAELERASNGQPPSVPVSKPASGASAEMPASGAARN